MAIDADSRGVVARFLPGIVLRLHDVAVHAGLRIRLEIREPLRVAERVGTDAPGDAKAHGQQQRQGSGPCLLRCFWRAGPRHGASMAPASKLTRRRSSYLRVSSVGEASLQ